MKRMLIVLCALAGGFAIGRWSVSPVVQEVRVSVLVRTDTVRVVQPEVMVVKQLPTVAERLPLAGSTDSAEVEVPVEQRIYEQPGFRAYVSGHRARLDSIFMAATTREVRVEVAAPRRKAPRFSVGIQAGYGLTPQGLQPFIGVGVSVNIASF